MFKTIFMTLAIFTLQLAQAGTIKDVMENQLEPAFKVIFASYKQSTITAETAKAAVAMRAALETIKNETPEFVPSADGSPVALTSEQKSEYIKAMALMIAQIDQLIVAINSHDLDGEKGFKKTVEAMRGLQRKSHDAYKPE